MRIPGRAFRLGRHWESASHLRCCDVFFTPAPCIEFDSPRVEMTLARGHCRLSSDRHRICFGLRHCAENPRVRFANPHRLRPPAGALARGLKTLTRFLYARALHRVRFSAGRDDVGAGALSAVIRSTSHLFWAEALRGESACSLREPAPASAACRRPRPRAKNAHAFSLRPRPA